MTKKNQNMNEADLSGLQKQMEDLTALVKQGRDETNPPKWWEVQENKITAMESRMATNQSYVEELLKILTGSRKMLWGTDKSRFTYKPDEPGILKAKPDDCVVLKNGNQLGENSESRPKLLGSETERRGPGSSFISSGSMWHRPKIEFPFFEGVNPRGWLQKCLKYFSLCNVPNEQRIEVATMYLTGKAEVWFDGYNMQKHHVTWHEFDTDLCHRFCDRYFADIVEELSKLVQKGSVEEYQDRFEELQPHMLLQNPTLGEEFFVSLFISGLREDIKHRVKVLEPKTLSEACRQAKLYELSVEYENKRGRAFFRNPPYPNPLPSNKPNFSNPQQKSSPNLPPKQNLLEYRRQNNLCYKCGEKFSPGHQCKIKQLNMMIEDEPVLSSETLPNELEQQVLQDEESLEISMNVITGCIGHNTLRIQGTILGRPLNILIDSGSTHSFLTPQWADAGIQVTTPYPLAITVANGQQLFSTARCNRVEWQMQGHSFIHDFRLLQLGGSDMVLGVDWMKLVSPILMDFNKLTLSFVHQNEQIVINGQQPSNFLQQISGATLLKMTVSNSALLGYAVLMNMTESSRPTPTTIQPLLEKYNSIFAKPTGLPPTRTHDHTITLKPDSMPVNLRPYRFPHNKKAEVEKQIAAMLSFSIIQPSKSPFASPCLLIKKKDGTWRFCVDYRQLNSMTIKDKFPIPVVEDLLDELHGAVYFSKIDLRSGYWQIRIKEEDIYKTAFRTHQGHYEFKTQVEYLGHIISAAGVATDPSKIEAMRNWPLPKSLKSLRGFLGLTGYYRRFIKYYGAISKPLTQMLKKDCFKWNSAALTAFEELKRIMCLAHVLALPDFTKIFYLETDASSGGIGAVLSQEGRPIAFLSKALSQCHAAMSIYEKEYLAILLAVSKWRHYLESKPFIIKTDHEPLKYLLEQKLTTAIQKRGLTKLLGLDYTIQYRKGISNIVADALSRQWEDQAQCLVMGTTLVIPTWVQEVEESYKDDFLATEWISILTVSPNADSKWKYSKGILRFQDRVYIGTKGSLRLQILQTLHDSPHGGHSGTQATYQRIRSYFYWPKLKAMVATYVRVCPVCQQTKVEHVAKPGLLQPLPIPQQAWEIITMDFIEGLHTSLKKNCILVVVDKFTKYSHFVAISHPYTAAEVAKLYLDNIYKLHGQPKVAISDRDKPSLWAKWLSHAEWWYNTTYHTALKLTPFQALYGYAPPTMVWQSDSPVHSVMGEEVYLKLQPYRQTTLALRKNLKLAARYYGPYKITEKIGEVAYRLALPETSRLHPVFHVSLLKKHMGQLAPSSTDPPDMTEEGEIKIEPLQVMGRRIVNRKHKPVTQLLVRWKNLDDSCDTWEDYTVLKGQFPNFDPWGQGSAPAAGIVMVGEGDEEGGEDVRGGEERIGENDKRGLGIAEGIGIVT
ncbi:uncharacterized protein LOC120177547 [Hibiscus syriacus]|uniref:uncharacterized protein LOC120177547 n=1 Tax=Hibiscus syriacus TaxID=106335 RepID=UPI0019232722|nr:uncharacterized protein LOC120177547 [Hibiscus syriacus]